MLQAAWISSWSSQQHESTHGLMIGRGILLHNLYVLEPIVPASGIILILVSRRESLAPVPRTSINFQVKAFHWYFTITTSSLYKSDMCHVCPLAKQKRLLFISNNNMSKSPFDLVHTYVWGLFAIESVEGYRYFLPWSMIVLVSLGFI